MEARAHCRMQFISTEAQTMWQKQHCSRLHWARNLDVIRKLQYSIDGNTIYNVQNGIDCDGASIAVTSCNVTNNMVYDAGSPDKWGTGIFLEDSFNGLVKGNAVYNIINGAGFYAVNYGNAAGPAGSRRAGWNIETRIRTRSLKTI